MHETFKDAYDIAQGFIKPIKKHKLQNFRETAINYEILLEMKYKRIESLINKFKEDIEKLRRKNHFIKQELSEAVS